MTVSVQLVPILYQPRGLARQVQNAVMQAAAQEAAWCKDFFTTSTATWEHEVKWRWGAKDASGVLEAYAGTDDLIYLFVSGGTRDHPITPVHAKKLVFQWGGVGSYKPKTVPGVMGSQSGGPTGPIVGRMSVHHPGTAPRNFDKVAADEWGKRWPTAMQEAITRALKSS